MPFIPSRKILYECCLVIGEARIVVPYDQTINIYSIVSVIPYVWK